MAIDENTNQSFQLMKLILDNSGDMMIITDKDSNFIYSNKTTVDLFGYKHTNELIQRNAFDMRCPAVGSAEQFIVQDQQVITTESKYSFNLLSKRI